jgi:glycosyltransferase 2 family protein
LIKSRWPIKALLAVLAASMVVYGLVLQLWGGGAGAPLALLWSGTGLLIGALCFLNFVLRGLRWRLWMAHQGRHFPLLVALRLYLAGYTFTPTPGNIGEVLRGVMLARQPLTLAQSLSIFGAERLADFFCLLLLCLPALAWVGQGLGMALSPWAWVGVFAGGVIALVVAWVLAIPVRDFLLGRFAWLKDAWTCLAVRPLLWFALTLVAWVAQGLAVWLICRELGLDLSPLTASGVYAVAMVAGALSTLPAGLGSMEATQAGLLALHGASASQAIAMTALTRIFTLWLAVATGMVALFYSVTVSKDVNFT